jgi:hypothetical protein
MTYAAHVTNGIVTQVIVGNATWANEMLDGEWLDTATLVGIGWLLVDGEIVPPAPDPTDIEPDDVTD